MKLTILQIALIVLGTSTDSAAQVLTKSYDAARSSETSRETVLTPAAVAAGMTKLQNIPCIGDARGCEAQPLIDVVPTGPVMILASEANVIRGVNPADGTGIWQTAQLCVPIKADRTIDMWGTNDHFGILSTGVIDPDTHKLYQVASCSSDGSGSPASMQQRMFVVDTRTGNVLANTLVTGSDQGMNYGDAPRKQRSALLLWNHNGVKTVIILAGSFSETGATATGWLLAFDTFDNRFKAALATRAGGWMSGQGPAMESTTGLIYLGLGNGTFNGVNAFGEAMLQVQYTPPTATTAAAFTVLNAWAPFSDAARTCANPQLTQPTSPLPASTITGTSAPGAAMPMSTACNASWGDQDANLTGTLLEKFHLYLSAGKDGIGYVANTLKFPRTQPADFANPKANCAKVGIYQFGWNLGVDPCPSTQSALNIFAGGKTRHIHSPPAQYTAPDGTTYVLFFAENSPLQVWRVNAGGSMSYVARGAEMASAGVTTGTGGMPGGFCTVSDNNGAAGIAWCSIPNGDANRTVTNGYLVAYDLTQLASGKVPTIWTSGTYTFNKFMSPVVYSGQVILPDYAGSVMHFTVGGQR